MIETIINAAMGIAALVTAYCAPIAAFIFLGSGVPKQGQPANRRNILFAVVLFAAAGVSAAYLSGGFIELN